MAAGDDEAHQQTVVAVPAEPMELNDAANNGLVGEDDDADYLATHSHPRAHPHEKEPTEGAFRVLYALEGGDPDAEVEVAHEPPGAKVGAFVGVCGFGSGSDRVGGSVDRWDG